MTVLAGVFCRDSFVSVPPGLKDELRRHLRKAENNDGNWHIHDSSRLFIIKWDCCAFKEPAWYEEQDGSICTLTGDPLAMDGQRRPSRMEQLLRLAPINGPLSYNDLRNARGSFALIRYDAKRATLYLATDALGLRSMYYTIQGGLLIFATALRVLEDVSSVIKRLSAQGMAELGTFSFPLAERTPYEGISILRECEVLRVDAVEVQVQRYYDWAATDPPPTDPRAAAESLYAEFKEAIRIRAGNDQRVYAFLSGGMDSRSIVTLLIEQGRYVEALNFSPDNSQDQYFAKLFAEAAGPRCRLYCLPRNKNPNFSLLAFSAKKNLENRETISVDRPSFIWSGDGGSVGLGHEYMDEAILSDCDKEDLEGAVKHFLAYNNLAPPWNILSHAARSRLFQFWFKNIMAEVNRYPCKDLGRQIYFFLLFNDQRRHLSKHFETIDQHGLEYLTPFFDIRLLRLIVSTDSRWGVLHRLYSQWFRLFPPFARATPWQTYPGHEPCPVPCDTVLSYQWEKQPQRESVTKRIKVISNLIKAVGPGLPPRTFSRLRLALVMVLHIAGLRNYQYVLSFLRSYRRFFAVTIRDGQDNLREHLR